MTQSKSEELVPSNVEKQSLISGVHPIKKDILLLDELKDDKNVDPDNISLSKSDDGDREKKRRIAKAFQKAEILNIGGSGAKTYVDQIFDFIRVYDRKFMTVRSENDNISEVNESQIPPNSMVITQQSSKPYFRAAFDH